MIYLDAAATTPLDPRVREAMFHTTENFGNPSSQHQAGRQARAALEEARRNLASAMGVSPRGLILTSGATESNNLALRGLAYDIRRRTGRKTIISSVVEHPSVYECLRELEREGFELKLLDPGAWGAVTPERLRAALSPDTALVSLIFVNNETGALTELEPLLRCLHDYETEVQRTSREERIVFHTDAVQGFGRYVIPAGVDAISFTAHKLGGPKGAGGLYLNPDLGLQPLFRGGSQERKFRPGTESLFLARGLEMAASLAFEERETRLAKLQDLRSVLLEALDQEGVPYEVNEPQEGASYPGTLNLWFKGQDAMQSLIRLDLMGIMVSAGSACAAGSLEPSRVLTSLRGENHPALKESLRVSFTADTPPDDLRHFAQAMKTIARSGAPQEG